VDKGTVDSDVWYMLIDSTADALRIDVVQTEQLSAPRNSNSHIDLTAVQPSTGQTRDDGVLCDTSSVSCVLGE